MRRYFADLIIAHLREALAAMLLAPAAGEAWLQALPPPMFAGNEASPDAVCLKGEAFRSAAVRAKASSPILRRPSSAA